MRGMKAAADNTAEVGKGSSREWEHKGGLALLQGSKKQHETNHMRRDVMLLIDQDCQLIRLRWRL